MTNSMEVKQSSENQERQSFRKEIGDLPTEFVGISANYLPVIQRRYAIKRSANFAKRT